MGPTGWTAAIYGGMSVIAFTAFAVDKAAAGRGGGRVPEATLHLLELLGGWPGAILGAVLLRHKTRKPSYLLVTGLVAALHLAGWWWFRGRTAG
jgi:uncharacterized membrane protein YsdA (DUF1294 family)